MRLTPGPLRVLINAVTTRRQLLERHLRDGEATARDLALLLGAQIKTVLADLEHVRRSHRKAFRVRPAECTTCGFIFRKRDRLSTPSRCPECRSERTVGPWMEIR